MVVRWSIGTDRILVLLLNSGARGVYEFSSMIAERRKYFASKLMDCTRLRRLFQRRCETLALSYKRDIEMRYEKEGD
jgi:hypothetical protein